MVMDTPSLERALKARRVADYVVNNGEKTAWNSYPIENSYSKSVDSSGMLYRANIYVYTGGKSLQSPIEDSMMKILLTPMDSITSPFYFSIEALDKGISGIPYSFKNILKDRKSSISHESELVEEDAKKAYTILLDTIDHRLRSF